MRFMENNLSLPLNEVLKIMQNRMMNESTYFGIKTLKGPIDFWIYQEIIFETQPDVIIEIGNFCGGSALALAHICDCLGKGRVIGVDLSHEQVPDSVKNHPRITLIEGDACESFSIVKELVNDINNIIVIEDSAHTFENTLKVLDTYSVLINLGGYFIVEDGICHHGLEVGPHPGPYEAIDAFIEKNKRFEIDRSRESFLVTWNPKGYLRRVGE
jgi:cephalosporin hydroxylase